MLYKRMVVLSVDISKNQVEKVLKVIKKCNASVGEAVSNKISASQVEVSVPVTGNSATEMAQVLMAVENTKGTRIKEVQKIENQ